MEGLTLDRLKALLKEKEEREEKLKEEREKSSPFRNDEKEITKEAIHEFYREFGILGGPVKGIWKRQIPDNVYRCPLSEPMTTLVEWNSLPKAIQDRYPKPQDSDGSNGGGVVEIKRRDLLAEEVLEDDRIESSKIDPTSAARGLQRRPLGGNLTNKLTEYTRGRSGQANPFTPGGLDADELAGPGLGATGKEKITNEFLTPEAIERSLRVLKQGSKASWKDGSLILGPPGVDFKVGLSYKDIYGKNDDDDANENTNSNESTESVEFKESEDEALKQSTANGQRMPTNTRAIQWEQSFLDDDSLFGSSVSDSDSDISSSSGDSRSDSDTGEENDGVSEDDEDTKPKEEISEKVDGTTEEIPRTDNVEGSDQEIDQLLSELMRAEKSTKKEIIKKHKEPNMDDGTANNPLRLAERQAKLQNDTTRKSWASTALLPIEDFHSYIPNPAMTYPFTLDTFQQQAVARLERNESVFVAAHTSAGKTVVAEYAVALAKQRGTRCIYTSPIKALSNQKFRDFSLKYGSENVGLITGDMQVNADDSTCLIMTTEILRSMLYRGADLIRDIEFVVFDEVHYVNDSERGVVWEEVIIMLPAYVNLIFLSATTPNTFEFSDWIGRTKRRRVYVIKTDYRPVPLSHFLWANLKLHKVKEGKSGFLDKGYQEATTALRPKEKKTSAGGGKQKQKAAPKFTGRGPQNMAWQAQGGKSQWMSLVRFLEREDLTPTVVFSFSKKKCEEIANMLRSLSLNTASESAAIQQFTLQTIARLSPIDQSLPQVLTVCEMVKRGIGVHHGGLLPILKEMVEILFSRNLIKVLFATETFAMGVNMPARAVVFNSIRKHDGNQFRVLEPGEYTQMAGRAGRRGLDKVGTVIMCCFGEQPPPVGMLRTMLTGTSTMLRSQFRLTYNMILNLLRVEEMSVESMIKRSFSEFATQRALTSKEYPKLLARGQKTLSKLKDQFNSEAGLRIGAEDIEDYFSSCNQLMELNSELLSYITGSTDGSGDDVLNSGRVVIVSAARKYGIVRAPGMILETKFATGGASEESGKVLESMVCMVLLPEHHTGEGIEGREESKARAIGEIGFSKQRYYGIYEIKLDQILFVAASKVKIEPGLLYKAKPTGTNRSMGGLDRGRGQAAFFGKPMSRKIDDPFAGMMARGKKNDEDAFAGKKKATKTRLSSESAIENAMELLIGYEKDEATSGIPLLNMMDCLKRGSGVVELRNRASLIEELAAQLRSCQSHGHRTLTKYYALLERIHTLEKRVQSLSHLLSNEALQLFPDFLHRKAVLTTLGYLDESEAVAVKGRVACEVNTCEELIVTEMVFEGILNDLDPTEIVAALSALVYQQKSIDDEFDIEVPESLLDCCKRMKTIALNLGQLQKEHGLDLDPIDYADSTMKFGLVHVVYEWAIGVPFSEICQLTDAQEGFIVRCITRLDELCREVRNCARVVGNPTLYRKMEAASAAIKRDIVFAASLYVS